MINEFGSGQPPEWWHVWLAAITALWGGLLSYFRKLQEGHKHTLLSAVVHLSTSGFAGLMCWLGLMQIEAPGYITAFCTGLAGHMGVEFVTIIENRFADKLKGGS